jgi:Pectate lyase superfamily protein
MPKSIPTLGDSNWGTPLNAHISQLQNPTNGAINSFEQFSGRPTTLTADDAGKTYLYTQTGNIHQWNGNTWKVLNESVINVKDYGAVGDGVTDDTLAIQAAVNKCTKNQEIHIADGTFLSKEIIIPITNDITITGGGSVKFVNTAFGFHRIGRNPDGPQGSLKTRFYIHNIKIIGDNSITIYEDQLFNSGGNLGVEVDHCEFVLSNSSIGIQFSGSYFHKITTNIFYNNTNDCISLRIKSGTSNLTSPQVGTVGFNTFWLGTALDQTFQADTISVWEGWYFTNNHYFASKVRCTGSNSIKFNQEEFVSSQVILDGALNTQISNCYFDRGPGDFGFPLLTISCNFRNSLGIQINDNQFNSQGNVGDCILLDGTQNATSSQLTMVTISNNYYAGFGGGNDVNNQANAIVVKGPVTHISILGENVFNMYSCIKLLPGAFLVKSTILGLDARDTGYFALGITPINIDNTECSSFYKILDAEIITPTYIPTNVLEPISGYTVNTSPMLMQPIITVNNTFSTDPNLSIDAVNSRPGSIQVRCIKKPAAIGNQRVVCNATLILDGTKIVAR